MFLAFYEGSFNSLIFSTKETSVSFTLLLVLTSWASGALDPQNAAHEDSATSVKRFVSLRII